MGIDREAYLHLLNKDAPAKRKNQEGILQLQILKYLKAKGYYVGKTKTMGVKRGDSFHYDKYLMRGKCDLECFALGVMFGIEVKSEKGKLSEDQEYYKSVFHKPPDRIFIEARCLEDVSKVI